MYSVHSGQAYEITGLKVTVAAI